jgi:hypothetical protein
VRTPLHAFVGLVRVTAAVPLLTVDEFEPTVVHPLECNSMVAVSGLVPVAVSGGENDRPPVTWLHVTPPEASVVAEEPPDAEVEPELQAEASTAVHASTKTVAHLQPPSPIRPVPLPVRVQVRRTDRARP